MTWGMCAGGAASTVCKQETGWHVLDSPFALSGLLVISWSH